MFRALTLFLFPAALAASDWTQFRGSDVSGVATNSKPPVTFDANSIAWKSALPGRGLSSPVIVGDKVFVSSASGPKQETLHVLCFQAADGKPLWDREFKATGRTMCHPKTCNAAPTPCSDGKRLYVLYSSNDLLCLDLDGNLLWLRALMVDYPNASNSLGLASSPVVADGVLVVQMENDSESFTAGLDAATGANKWRNPGKKDANWTSPALIREEGLPSTVIISSSSGAVALDPQTGKQRWDLPGPGNSMSSCTANRTHLVQPLWGKGVAVWELKGGTTPPVKLWDSPQVGSDTASPVFVGDYVFSLNGAGVLICAGAKTGDRPWKLRMDSKDNKFSGSPVAAGTTIYVASEKGILYALDTTAAEGAISGKLDLKDTILCTPSISGNSLYVRSDTALWRIGK
ncbi:MAG TPA: PQQ-binding-like beta-propeller repeat protein [Verrucomicrobiales bacterium]|nr:PQQ-binding-like beta-propeller repeat protein [Verrucomicrobiales bacterium]